MGAPLAPLLAITGWPTVSAPVWIPAPVWFHGDVAVGNLLVDDAGRLSAVLDFGTCGVGDPACDLVIAWTLFDGPSRERFRRRTALDDAAWARARGWALWKALITLAAPDATLADRAGAALTFDRALDDVGRGGRRQTTRLLPPHASEGQGRSGGR